MEEGAADLAAPAAGRTEVPALGVAQIDQRLIASGIDQARIVELVPTDDGPGRADRSLRQEPRTRLAFAMRTTGDPDALIPAVGRALRDVDPDQPADDVISMRGAIKRGTIGIQYVAGIMSAFGVLALVLALSGVYGILSYRVSLRTVEIGVRMALGATRRDVLALTLGQAARLSAIGLAAGAALAFGMGRLLSSALRGAVASDPALVGLTTVVLALAALVAAWIPSRRAMGIEPATALRSE